MTRLPAGWRETTLGQLGQYWNGRGFKKSEWRGFGRPIIRIQNLTGSNASFNYFDGEPEKRYTVERGDLLVSWAATLGAYIWDGPEAVVNQHIFKVDSNIDTRLHKYLLDFKLDALMRETHGSGMVHITRSRFDALPVAVPESEVEQRRIVELLDDHLSRLDAAESYLGAVRRRLVAYQQQSLETVLAAASSEHVALGSVLDRVEAGKSFGGSASPAIGDEWGVIKVSAMTWGEFRPEENKAVPSDVVNPAYEIAPGDVLVSRANTTAYVGAPVLVRKTPRRRLLSDKSLRLVPRPDVDREWLIAALSAPGTRRQISAAATGTSDSMRNISQKNLLSVQIPWVPADDQSRVVERLAAVRTAATALAQESQRSDARSQGLRRAVLDAAFSGRLTGHASDMDRVEELVAAPL